MIKIILILVLLNISSIIKGQDKNKEVLYQNINGIVRDSETNKPIAGATIVIEETNHGSITDSLGKFILKCSTGRHNLIFSHVGYQNQKKSMFVNSGHESNLLIILEPNITRISGVIVKAPFQKEKPINKLVYASGRSFSTEDAYRYAGTLGDAARMVRNYAGVMPERDDRNDIIIRGNSPTGLLWRINDIEIPNPNHFGGIGLTGSTVTLLNTNMITNSDFITGAFPAEYGNAMSGVFDLKLKNPNPDKHEFRFQTGWNGFELGAEGPFSKKKNTGTHMTAYRYSFLDVMDKIGVDFGIVPQYQDFTTIINLNVSPKSNISLIGLWGTSFIELDDQDREMEEIKTLHGQHLKTGSDLLLGGINAKYKPDNNNQLNLSFSALRNLITTRNDTFNLKTDQKSNIWHENSVENKYSFFAELTNYSIPKNLIKTGIRWETYDINYFQEGIIREGLYDTLVDSKEILHLFRFYMQDEYRFSNSFNLTLGFHSLYFFFNHSFAIEPRMAIKYKPFQNHTLSFAYGRHNQIQVRSLYLLQTPTPEGPLLTNRNLDYSVADHWVVSHDWSVWKNARIKTEAYYQYLHQIPVEEKDSSVFSMLNSGADFYTKINDSLVNKGKGKNYGIELTFEKFFDNHYYFMVNSTLYQSKYTGGDNRWRNTVFNTSYILNLVTGYEWSPVKNKTFGADLNLTFAGGKPYIPVKEQESTEQNKVVYDYSKAYKYRYNEYFRTDLKLYYRMNYSKFYIEFAVDLQNLTNNKNIFYREFIPETGDYNTYYHMKFFPMYTFKCLF